MSKQELHASLRRLALQVLECGKAVDLAPDETANLTNVAQHELLLSAWEELHKRLYDYQQSLWDHLGVMGVWNARNARFNLSRSEPSRPSQKPRPSLADL